MLTHDRVKENTRAWWAQRDTAARELLGVQFGRELRGHPDAWRSAARPVESGMPDSVIRGLAEERARIVSEWLVNLTQATDTRSMLALLNQATGPLDGKPFTFDNKAPEGEQLRGFMERVKCPMWWRRQLRRAVVHKREDEARKRGEVCKRRRQVYVTDDTVSRRAERNGANAAMLANTEIEDAHGEIITLAQAVAASTANKAIRRGELMTRIRGCEEWAAAAGMVGIFTTNTTPSRYHPQTMHHGANPKHDGSTPRDAQGWLCKTWARARAALHRAGVGVFGFRVAEPHHDGCPHWHMLLWCEPRHLEQLRETMRRYWLKDAGDEAGAQEHRFKAVNIDPAKGSAVAYVAKYISKNIDDIGVNGHADEHAGEQAELFGATASRVEAWAGANQIRQFQAIGQPPVTVWRELRRVDAASVAGASDTLKAAHQAVHREGERRADWRAYMQAQGGAMVGRGYRVRIVADTMQREGRYGLAEVERPIGLEDTQRPGECVLSGRREWKPRGQWRTEERLALHENVLAAVVWGEPAKPVRPPRTRFNNCTVARGMAPLWAALKRDFSDWNGGVHTKENHEPPGNPDRKDHPAIQS